MEVGLEIYNGLLPARCHTKVSASAAILASAVGGSYFLNFNVINSLNSVSYLRFVGFAVYLKGVCSFYVGKVHSLLSNQRPNYYAKIVHSDTFLVLTCLVFVQDRQERLFGKQHFAVTADIAGVQLLHRHNGHFRDILS